MDFTMFLFIVSTMFVCISHIAMIFEDSGVLNRLGEFLRASFCLIL